MMVLFSFNHIILIFIISLLLLLERINGKSLDGSEILRRRKREDGEGPEVIKIKIHVDGKEEDEIEVSKLKENYIANENLKVWTFDTNASNSQTKSKIKQKNDVQEEIGKWDMYQNKTLRSAVVYFRKLKLLGGIVGKKKYIINFVNYEGSNEVTVTDPPHEASTRSKRESKDTFERLADSFPDMQRISRSINNTTITPKIEFYLESLVVVSGSLTNSFSSTIDAESLKYKHYVMHVLVFFNLINVKFPKTFKINVAGILLKEKSDDLPFFEAKNSLDKVKNQIKVISAREALENFLKQCEPQINSDVYDYAIHLTDYTLHSEYTDKNINAFLSYPTQGIYAARQAKSPSSHPLIITSSSFTYASVSHAAHQIYHVIGGWNYVDVSHNNMSFRVITDDIHDYQCYFKWNKDWCAFVNEPHSLGSTPRKLLTLDEHCWCSNYAYRYHNITNTTAIDICADGFQCLNINNNTTMKVTMVMNGTPCGEEKVCWNNVCVPKA
ncbi:uncharacterized protein [Chelonus insularis]|uniref:uncharacterized protein n=1 Tax=Chelonus insularis TaxID=460826 RepID=UPI00158B2CEA|nr:uncharacterized protein LOC118064881 [Chelonus insularis]